MPFGMMPIRLAQVTLICLAFSSAAAASSLKEIPSVQLPSLALEGDLPTFRTALEKQIESCEKDSTTRTLMFGTRKVTRKEWCLTTGRAFLRLARSAPDFATLMTTAKSQFLWFRSTGATGAGDVTFTGYYFPSLEASRVATARFSVPLYRRPPELVQTVVNGKKAWRRKNPDGSHSMFHDRRAIDEHGALAGRGLEIAYVEDAYEAFIFEVQGAGALNFTRADGTKERVVLNYAAQNGHPYVAIRRVLKDRGVPEEFLSMPGMKRWFKANPRELKPVLYENPSYVFFKEDADGPLGTEVVLSPGHSIAIDPAAHPMGAVALFRASRPLRNGDLVAGWVDIARLAVTQDVGGAIRGAGKVDVYWGEGPDAEFAAGHMNQPGELFVPLLP